MHKSEHSRLRLLSFFIVLFALLLIVRLYLVQIVSGDNFEAKAAHQYVAGSNHFNRGNIYFTNKDQTLVTGAGLKLGYTLYINPKILSGRHDIEQIYEKLNNITTLDKTYFIEKTLKKTRVYEEIAKRLSPEIAEKIRSLKIDGIGITQDRWRIYPGGIMAAHTIGLIGYRGDELAGRYGLERFYEDVLKRGGEDIFVNFFAEIFSNIQKAVSQDQNFEGDIVTTIEPSVEAFVESELQKVTTKYTSDFSGGIVINPRNGEILAIALTPTFDPNAPQNEQNSKIFSHKLVEDRYEMGSIIKALTLAIGLDSGVITAKTTYNDLGCMTLNTRTFCNYDGKSHGTTLSMQTVLNKSLNTGAAYVVSRVGSQKFNKAMLAFGLDTLTGIDLPNEGKTLVSNLKTTRELESAQASFGQGIALTPINTVRALSALANGGTLVTPHLVKEIKYKLGPSKFIMYPEEERSRAISPEASAEISRMLTEVVDRSLRDGQVRLENHSIAAKTGTAQIAKAGGGGYYDDRYLHSFFGYFPSYEPEFLVFLYTYDPKNVQYASETLTDTFMNITKFLINYYNIPPDRETPPPKSV
jgi:cell division protein FtsI/penicillin-binding protein 2